MSASEDEIREAERQVLLTGLDVVYQYLKLINDLNTKRIQLTGSFRGYQNMIQPLAAPKQKAHVDPTTAKMRAKLFLTVFSVAMCLTAAAWMLIFNVIRFVIFGFNTMFLFENGNNLYILLCLAAAAYLFKARDKKSKVKVFIYVAAIYVFVYTLFNIGAIHPVWLAIMVAVLISSAVGSIIVVKWLLRKDNQIIDAENDAEAVRVAEENQRIAAQNKKITAQNQATEQYNLRICDQIAEVDRQIDQLTREMMEAQGAWFPPDYYNLYAVEQFMTEVANFRAYTVQEMVNIFEQSEHWKREETGQQQIMAQLGQIHFGLGRLNAGLGQLQSSQERIIGQLRFADALQVQKMFQDQWNVEELKETIRLNPPVHYHYHESPKR